MKTHALCGPVAGTDHAPRGAQGETHAQGASVFASILATSGHTAPSPAAGVASAPTHPHPAGGPLTSGGQPSLPVSPVFGTVAEGLKGGTSATESPHPEQSAVAHDPLERAVKLEGSSPVAPDTFDAPFEPEAAEDMPRSDLRPTPVATRSSSGSSASGVGTDRRAHLVESAQPNREAPALPTEQEAETRPLLDFSEAPLPPLAPGRSDLAAASYTRRAPAPSTQEFAAMAAGKEPSPARHAQEEPLAFDASNPEPMSPARGEDVGQLTQEHAPAQTTLNQSTEVRVASACPNHAEVSRPGARAPAHLESQTQTALDTTVAARDEGTKQALPDSKQLGGVASERAAAHASPESATPSMPEIVKVVADNRVPGEGAPDTGGRHARLDTSPASASTAVSAIGEDHAPLRWGADAATQPSLGEPAQVATAVHADSERVADAVRPPSVQTSAPVASTSHADEALVADDTEHGTAAVAKTPAERQPRAEHLTPTGLRSSVEGVGPVTTGHDAEHRTSAATTSSVAQAAQVIAVPADRGMEVSAASTEHAVPGAEPVAPASRGDTEAGRDAAMKPSEAGTVRDSAAGRTESLAMPALESLASASGSDSGDGHAAAENATAGATGTPGHGPDQVAARSHLHTEPAPDRATKVSGARHVNPDHTPASATPRQFPESAPAAAENGQNGTTKPALREASQTGVVRPGVADDDAAAATKPSGPGPVHVDAARHAGSGNSPASVTRPSAEGAEPTSTAAGRAHGENGPAPLTASAVPGPVSTSRNVGTMNDSATVMRPTAPESGTPSATIQPHAETAPTSATKSSTPASATAPVAIHAHGNIAPVSDTRPSTPAFATASATFQAHDETAAGSVTKPSAPASATVPATIHAVTVPASVTNPSTPASATAFATFHTHAETAPASVTKPSTPPSATAPAALQPHAEAAPTSATRSSTPVTASATLHTHAATAPASVTKPSTPASGTASATPHAEPLSAAVTKSSASAFVPVAVANHAAQPPSAAPPSRFQGEQNAHPTPAPQRIPPSKPQTPEASVVAAGDDAPRAEASKPVPPAAAHGLPVESLTQTALTNASGHAAPPVAAGNAFAPSESRVPNHAETSPAPSFSEVKQPSATVTPRPHAAAAKATPASQPLPDSAHVPPAPEAAAARSTSTAVQSAPTETARVETAERTATPHAPPAEASPAAPAARRRATAVREAPTEIPLALTPAALSAKSLPGPQVMTTPGAFIAPAPVSPVTRTQAASRTTVTTPAGAAPVAARRAEARSPRALDASAELAVPGFTVAPRHEPATPRTTTAPTQSAPPITGSPQAAAPSLLDLLAAGARIQQASRPAQSMHMKDSTGRRQASGAGEAPVKRSAAQPARGDTEAPSLRADDARSPTAPARASEGAPAAPVSSSAPVAEVVSAPAAAPLGVLPSALLEDSSLRVVLLPNVARMSIDTDGGHLQLQVRTTDGVADVRATGPAAPAFEARQGELRMALAREGLSLGQFDLPNSERRAPERPDAPDELPRRPGAATRNPDRVHDGGLHVTA